MPDFSSPKSATNKKATQFSAFASAPAPTLQAPKARVAGQFVPVVIPKAQPSGDFYDFDSGPTSFLRSPAFPDFRLEDSDPKPEPPKPVQPLPRRSEAISIAQPIWNPLTSVRADRDESPARRGRNKSKGKIAINSESNLSSSTEDLLVGLFLEFLIL